MTSTTSSFSGVGGTTIEYDVYEPEGEPKGLILVSHGLGEHRGRYEHVADRLTALGLRVAVPDHRGHGKSGGPRCDTRDVTEFTTDLETLRKLTVIDGKPTYLLGHSMGGLIALDYALDHQSDLTALMLSGALVLPGEDQPPYLIAIAKVLGKVVPTLGTLALDPKSVSRDPKVVGGLRGRPAQLPRQGQGRDGRGAAQPAQDLPRPAPVTDAAAAGDARREGQADQPRGQQAGRQARRLDRQDPDDLPGPVPRDLQRARAGPGPHRPDDLAREAPGRPS